MVDKTAKIRELNDLFRKTLSGGRVMITEGVQALPPGHQVELLERVKAFADFSDSNDTHGEHDFGSVEIEGQKFFWKIDYYNNELDGESDDPADASTTTRVLTIMRADE